LLPVALFDWRARADGYQIVSLINANRNRAHALQRGTITSLPPHIAFQDPAREIGHGQPIS
jgi:hypothetical protein